MTVNSLATWKSRVSGQHFVFSLTYLVYIGVYFTRKAFSVAKSTLKTENLYTEAELGAMDTAYLVTYAIAQLGTGLVGSVTGRKLGLVICFVGSGICALTFGLVDDKSVRSWAWMTMGLFQAMFFPFILSILNDFYPPASRGRVLGVWSTSPQIGGFATSAFGAWVLSTGNTLTWHAIFVWPALLSFGLALVCLQLLNTSPSDYSSVNGVAESPKPKSDLPFFEVLRMKHLGNVAGAYLFIKLVRFTFLGWLPFYLTVVLNYSAAEAVLLSTAFDIAGAAGTIGCGYIADKAFKGKTVIAVVPICLMLGLFTAFYPHIAAWGKVPNILVMGAVGMLVAGPDSVLSGAACAEVCDNAGHPRALTTAAGIAVGVGSVGAIASGMLPILVKDHFGWNVLFYLLGILSAAGALCILPVALAGLRHLSHEDKDTDQSGEMDTLVGEVGGSGAGTSAWRGQSGDGDGTGRERTEMKAWGSDRQRSRRRVRPGLSWDRPHVRSSLERGLGSLSRRTRSVLRRSAPVAVTALHSPRALNIAATSSSDPRPAPRMLRVLRGEKCRGSSPAVGQYRL